MPKDLVKDFNKFYTENCRYRSFEDQKKLNDWVKNNCLPVEAQVMPANDGLWAIKYDDLREAVNIVEVDAYGNTLRLITQMPSDNFWSNSGKIGKQIVDEHNSRLSA